MCLSGVRGVLFVVAVAAAFPSALVNAQGDGAVLGSVLDSFGLPVVGAVVIVESLSGYSTEVVTDAGGAFDLDSMVGGLYTLSVHAEGYVSVERVLDLPDGGRQRVIVSLVPEIPSGLVVAVVDSQGGALPGALVLARGPEGLAFEAAAGQAGRAFFDALRPGAWTVTASIGGFDAATIDVVVRFGVRAEARLELPLDFAVTETVVVVGSRRADEQRSVTESAVPVDVLTADALVAQPRAGLVEAVRTLAPSFNVNLQPISDAATIVRPINLRNLAPDHVLVLVNGKRRHRGAVIAWLGNGIADGSQGPDISSIPAIAVRQAELLRDGAAAQYGSDAIAGVINFELKDAREGGSFSFRSGIHRDRNTGARSTCGSNQPGSLPSSCNGIGDLAGAYSFAGNVGLPVGNAGFANFSVEYGGSEPTNRAVQREDASALGRAGAPSARDTAQVWGAPLVEDDLKTFANFGATLASGLQPYGHANYATRRVTGGFYYRHPHTRSGVFRGPEVDGRPTLLVGDRAWASSGVVGAGGCPAVPIVGGRPDPAALAAVEAHPDCFSLYSRFPGGFTPQFGGVLNDHSVVGGLKRTTAGGFTWDASVAIGRSRIDQFIFDTVNASLGYDTPTAFDPGSYEQHETNLNFDVSAPLGDRVHVAVGVERRVERFSIFAGDEASWRIGPYAEQGFSSGSNGFNGYRADTTSGAWRRSSAAVYADAEVYGAGPEAWTLGAALRYEDFDDFGSTLNGKLAVRYPLGEGLAARAAMSTGFRAPTPGQQNTFNVTTAFIDGELTNNGVVPSTSRVAVARGGQPLAPETSKNYSAGLVLDAASMALTADYFRIDVADRLAVSQEIRLRPDEIDILLAEGIAEARNFPVFRFFLNDFSTRTQGLDVLWSWNTPVVDLGAAWNYTRTEVRDLQTTVIDAFRIVTLETGLPTTRWNVTASTDIGDVGLFGRLSWWGSYWDSEDGRNARDIGVVEQPWLFPAYAGRALLDVEASVPLTPRATVALGVQNLLNTYPETNRYGALTVGNRFGQFSPAGFNGSYFYGRLDYRWGR